MIDSLFSHKARASQSSGINHSRNHSDRFNLRGFEVNHNLQTVRTKNSANTFDKGSLSNSNLDINRRHQRINFEPQLSNFSRKDFYIDRDTLQSTKLSTWRNANGGAIEQENIPLAQARQSHSNRLNSRQEQSLSKFAIKANPENGTDFNQVIEVFREKLQRQKNKLSQIDTQRTATLSVIQKETADQPSHYRTQSTNPTDDFASLVCRPETIISGTPKTFSNTIYGSEFINDSFRRTYCARYHPAMSNQRPGSVEFPRFCPQVIASKILHSNRKLMTLESELNNLLIKAQKR